MADGKYLPQINSFNVVNNKIYYYILKYTPKYILLKYVIKYKFKKYIYIEYYINHKNKTNIYFCCREKNQINELLAKT